jgi:hypothetical protein
VFRPGREHRFHGGKARRVGLRFAEQDGGAPKGEHLVPVEGADRAAGPRRETGGGEGYEPHAD